MRLFGSGLAPPIDEMRVIHGWAAPGATATTLGSTVFVRRGRSLSPRLRRHEYEHVRQFARHGWIGFFRRYLGSYVRWRLRGYGHKAAYRRLPFEVAAEWRARRELGIGTVRDPGRTRAGRPEDRTAASTEAV